MEVPTSHAPPSTVGRGSAAFPCRGRGQRRGPCQHLSLSGGAGWTGFQVRESEIASSFSLAMYMYNNDKIYVFSPQADSPRTANDAQIISQDANEGSGTNIEVNEQGSKVKLAGRNQVWMKYEEFVKAFS